MTKTYHSNNKPKVTNSGYISESIFEYSKRQSKEFPDLSYISIDLNNENRRRLINALLNPSVRFITLHHRQVNIVYKVDNKNGDVIKEEFLL